MSEDDGSATMFDMLRIEASKTKESHPISVIAAPKQKQPQPANGQSTESLETQPVETANGEVKNQVWNPETAAVLSPVSKQKSKTKLSSTAKPFIPTYLNN